MKQHLDFQLELYIIMNRLVISEETNPYYNLALEEELLRAVENDENILYLWQNVI